MLETTAPLPRVAFEQLGHFVGKRVRLVGEIVGFEGGVAKVKAADDGLVSVKIRGTMPDTKFAEFEGTVRGVDSLEEDSHTAISSSVDMANYNELCKLVHGQYRQLFF